jgi:hypothetical protein
MYFDSFNRIPSKLDLLLLSLPAKSIKCNFDTKIFPVDISLPSKVIVNMQ